MKNQMNHQNPIENLMNLLFKNDLVKSFNDENINNFKHNNNMVPPVNIIENELGFNIDVIVPGLSKEDIKLNVKENILTISYESKETAEQKTDKVLRSEFVKQSFKRSFTLGKQVNAENIQARMENGILSIVLPKNEVVKPIALDITIN